MGFGAFLGFPSISWVFCWLCLEPYNHPDLCQSIVKPPFAVGPHCQRPLIECVNAACCLTPKYTRAAARRVNSCCDCKRPAPATPVTGYVAKPVTQPTTTSRQLHGASTLGTTPPQAAQWVHKGQGGVHELDQRAPCPTQVHAAGPCPSPTRNIRSHFNSTS